MNDAGYNDHQQGNYLSNQRVINMINAYLKNISTKFSFVFCFKSLKDKIFLRLSYLDRLYIKVPDHKLFIS